MGSDWLGNKLECTLVIEWISNRFRTVDAGTCSLCVKTFYCSTQNQNSSHGCMCLKNVSMNDTLGVCTL